MVVAGADHRRPARRGLLLLADPRQRARQADSDALGDDTGHDDHLGGPDHDVGRPDDHLGRAHHHRGSHQGDPGERLPRPADRDGPPDPHRPGPVSYTHLRAHETVLDLVCRLLLEKKKQYNKHNNSHLKINHTNVRETVEKLTTKVS